VPALILLVQVSLWLQKKWFPPVTPNQLAGHLQL
jgi:hypothetical protein